jgi:hypothetical protein
MLGPGLFRSGSSATAIHRPLRSPRIKGREVASRFFPSRDADTIDDNTNEQRQQQHAACHNKTHATLPLERRFRGHLAPAKPDGTMSLPSPALAGADASDDDGQPAGRRCGLRPVISMGVACSPRKFATESLSVASDRHRTAQVVTSETAIMNATTAFTRLGGPGDSTGGSGATSRIGWPLHSKHRAQLKKAPRESPAAVWEETPLIRGSGSSVLPDSAQLQHGNRGHSLRSRMGTDAEDALRPSQRAE